MATALPVYGEADFNQNQLLQARLENLTTTQRDAIASPAIGRAIWNTTDNCPEIYGGTWVSFAGKLIADARSASSAGAGSLQYNIVPQYSNGVDWRDLNFRPSKTFRWYEDFGGANAGIAFSSGAGTGNGVNYSQFQSTGNEVGVARISTGTTTTGSFFVGGGAASGNYIQLGNGTAIYEERLAISVVSDGTNTFTDRVGFLSSTNGDPANGVFFRYIHSVNSGNWVCVCRTNNVETTLNTSIAPTITSTLQKLRIEVNAAGTSVEFFIAGVSQGTITTNIPTAANRLVSFGHSKTKSAGTTNVTSDIGYIWANIDFTTER